MKAVGQGRMWRKLIGKTEKAFKRYSCPLFCSTAQCNAVGVVSPVLSLGSPGVVMVAGAPRAISICVCGVCGCLRSWDFFPFLPQRGRGVREAPICRLPSGQHCCQGLHKCFKTCLYGSSVLASAPDKRVTAPHSFSPNCGPGFVSPPGKDG